MSVNTQIKKNHLSLLFFICIINYFYPRKTRQMNHLDNPLIRQIYEKRASNYPELRHLHTTRTMSNRLSKLKAMINKIPKEKRNSQNKKYKCLSIEFRLLQWKKIVYETADPIMASVKWQLQLTDRYKWESTESLERRLEGKKEHILPLLNMDMFKQSEEALTGLLHKIEDDDAM